MVLRRLIHLLLFCALILAHTTAKAQQRIAVLEISGDGSIEETGLQFLADKIREAALTHLDSDEWEVMTQENMLVLLEANSDDLAACVGECEVETGRLLGAHLVVAGSQIQFGSSYELILRSYETESGRLLVSASASAESLDGIRTQLDETCARLFGARVGAARSSNSESKEGDGVVEIPPEDVVSVYTSADNGQDGQAGGGWDSVGECVHQCKRALRRREGEFWDEYRWGGGMERYRKMRNGLGVGFDLSWGPYCKQASICASID